MSKAAPFTFTLNPTEIAILNKPVGAGGFQSFQQRLLDELLITNNTINLNDEEFGKLVRYMTRYKSGGFQGNLREAFIRSFQDLLDF